DAPRLQILHRLIETPVAELQLVGVATEREREELVPEADAEKRPFPEQIADRLHRVRHGRRVSGPARQENAVWRQRERLLGGGGGKRLCPTGTARAARDSVNSKGAAGVTRDTRSSPCMLGALRARSTSTSGDSRPMAPFCAPWSRRWRVSFRVSTSAMATTP